MEKRFNIAFELQNKQNTSVEVFCVATAFMKLNTIIQETVGVVSNRQIKIKLEVEAFRPGSLEIDLLINFVEYGGSLLSHSAEIIEAVSSKTVNALDLVRDNLTQQRVKGIFNLLSELRSRKPTKISRDTEGNARFHIKDEIITTEAAVKDIFENEKIRTDIEDFIKITESENISSIKINKADNGQFACKFEKSDITHYQYIKDIPDINKSKNEFMWGMEVISPAFRDQYTWRIQHRGQSYQLRILDEEFREKIKNREIKCGNGDQLRAIVRIIGKTRRGGNPQHGIVKVIKYEPAADQAELPI